MDAIALCSLVMLGFGAGGGLLNALLTDNLRLCPSIVRVTARTRIVRPGLAANLGLGALAAFGAFRALAPAHPPEARSSCSALLTVVGGLLVGLLAARWITNESDKRLLRAAACKASAAPAAHPDTVRAIELAPPFEVYNTADGLMPRHGS